MRLYLVSATRGEGGELGEPPVTTRADIGNVREHELRCASEALGISRVEFLGYIDPEIEGEQGLRPFDAPYERLVAQIYDAIRASNAELVLSHGTDGEYGHPAHLLMHRAVRDAVHRLGHPALFYTMAAAVPGIEDILWNKNDHAHLAIDIRPWLDAKERAALCHRSQHALFKRRKELETVRDALRTVEGFRRCIPEAEEETPDDAFARMLLAAGAWNPS